MLVKEIMTTSVKTARPTDPVRDIATIMCFNKISGLPVVDGEGNLVGMISEKDILHAMFPKLQDFIANPSTPDFEQLEREYRDVVSLRVTDLMTAIVYTAEPDMPVLKAASIMFRNRIRRIPVSQGGRLLGIISIGDVHKAMFRKNLTLPA
jgi:CBS domain-containing protein